MSKPYAPPGFGALARRVCEQMEWGRINHTYPVKRGEAVWYSCEGHGGFFARVPENLTATQREVLVRADCIQTALSFPIRRTGLGGTYLGCRVRVNVEPQRLWPSDMPYHRHELLMGEEDVGWAAVVLARPELAEHLANGGLSISSGEEVLAFARESVDRWYPDFVDAFEGVAA